MLEKESEKERNIATEKIVKKMIGKIKGLGSYLPSKVLTNKDLESIVETSDEWIVERTGIRERRISDPYKETVSEMAISAAKEALADSGIDPLEIDFIVLASTTNNMVFPTSACLVQAAIGADNAQCFDMNSACPGFLAAYNVAQNFISAGQVKTVLVIGSECISNYVDWTDRGSCILFGDGAGAAVLKATEVDDSERNKFIMKSSVMRGDCLHCENLKQPKRFEEEGFIKSTNMFMNGKEVFRFVVSEIPALVNELSQKYEFSVDDVDHFVFHQANKRIIEATAKKLNISMDKFPLTIHDTGNISSASIPVLLTQMKEEGTLKKGDKIIMSSFGGGLTWGANYFVY